MNIFVLDKDPVKAAKYLCDKHVVKMIVETAQLLSTAHHVLDKSRAPKTIYKSTHANHPCAKWVRECVGNYNWAFEHFDALLQEYTKRYKKTHKSQTLRMALYWPPKNIDGVVSFRVTPFAQAMPVQYKQDNAVEAYRSYYKGEKKAFATWKFTRAPSWFYK